VELAGHAERVHLSLSVMQNVQDGKFCKSDGRPLLEAPAIGVVVHDGNSLVLENVPIVTPNNDVLVQSVSFTISPGMHLLVTGPNGCGKSSLFRIVAGLWPLRSGHVTLPIGPPLFYLPQRPYLTLGTLREQIIYPDTLADAIEKGIQDGDLEPIMQVQSWSAACLHPLTMLGFTL
jgi:ABC-type uncharacterized transport system fused permease/ATPase subunit